ncbi:nuclear pore complex protein Nup107 [Teleopsis dalmanni]|uniref:nuclear pore complex protein Nup107 n=1 Tax=Teleopsis dalmanni TaxID=139649 RepID=UPI0018CF7EB3|nr:nuclear pore complex protein Nup107 [Teleopsis dalmanni]
MADQSLNLSQSKSVRNLPDVAYSPSARNVFLPSKLRKLLEEHPPRAGDTLTESSEPPVPNKMQRLLEEYSLIERTQHGLSNSSNATGPGVLPADIDEMSTTELSFLEAVRSEKLTQYTLVREKSDLLFPQFYELLQSRFNENEVFDTILDIVHLCAEMLFETHKDILHDGNTKRKAINAAWLEDEMKTWRLLYALYKDRLFLQADNANDLEIIPLGVSEKEVVTQLYTYNSTLREYQLVVDWLEACYDLCDTTSQIGHSKDASAGWENTLLQKKFPRSVAFGYTDNLVESLDPDAPVREKRRLHMLDEEDNFRLSKSIFHEIRQGRINEAIAISKYCGQTWRAAILEGWRLHDDPNYENVLSNKSLKVPVEGNPRRDLWKKCAWNMASSEKQDDYTRAIAGTYCGHLTSLKMLLRGSWEDLLWAYLKTQIDIRVESEIRSCCLKTYLPMPDDYWNNKMTLEQIFNELSVHSDSAIRDYASSKVGIIQMHLIMDNTSELLKDMNKWIEESKKSKPLTPHMLRFLTHIVLFLRQIGRVDKEEYADNVIEAYVEALINMRNSSLISFYTAALPGKSQIVLYAKYLDLINDSQERAEAVRTAVSARLDVENITKHTTIKQISRFPTDTEKNQPIRAGVITEYDQSKVNALEWLTFLPVQREELLWQTNNLIRFFLAENKTECVRAAFSMVPADTVAKIFELYGSQYNLPVREDCSVKEYLCYRVYLESINHFMDWSQLSAEKPKKPEEPDEKSTFTERIATEYKDQNHQLELNRWKTKFDKHTEVTRDALYNVLLFPRNGWLVDPDIEERPSYISKTDWNNRALQMEKLRSIYIPEIVNFLFEVMFKTEDYLGCVQLADEIASEHRKLYKVYTQHKMCDLLQKIAKASQELLNNGTDAFGCKICL